MNTDQDILNQTDLGRIRTELEKMNSRIGEPHLNENGETVGGTGLLGEFHRFRTKSEKRFGMYDRMAWVMTGAGSTIAVAAAIIWWLISPASSVNDLRAGSRAEVTQTR